MIRALTQDWRLPGRRRVSAFLLAICLNLAIMPCTMALEVVEQGHDCCPPEIQMEAAECCVLDDVSVDSRLNTIDPQDVPDVETLPASVLSSAPDRLAFRSIRFVNPPDPPGESVPLYDLFCVYLK